MKHLLVWTTGLMLVSASAFAVTNTTVGGGGDHPCKQDAQTYCSGIEKGQGRMAQCMKAHENQVSPACKAKMVEREQKHAERKANGTKEGSVPGTTMTNGTAH